MKNDIYLYIRTGDIYRYRNIDRYRNKQYKSDDKNVEK